MNLDLHASDGKGGSLCGINAHPAVNESMWKWVSCTRCQEEITKPKLKMKRQSAAVTCSNEINFRSIEAIARSYGFRSCPAKPDNTLWKEIANGNVSPTGRYILYIVPHTKMLEWDHETARIREQAVRDGYVFIDTYQGLFNYLDNPSAPPTTIPLNIEHSAVVYDDHVKVGCQKFTHQAVLNVAEEIKRRQRYEQHS